jgi:hypothetical protein
LAIDTFQRAPLRGDGGELIRRGAEFGEASLQRRGAFREHAVGRGLDPAIGAELLEGALRFPAQAGFEC